MDKCFRNFVYDRTDRILTEAGADLLIVSLPESVEYFSGFFTAGVSILYSSEGYFLYSPVTKKKALVTGAADAPSILELGFDGSVYAVGNFHFDIPQNDAFSQATRSMIEVRYGSFADAIAQAIKDLCPDAKTIYMDESRMPITTWRAVEAAYSARYIPGINIIKEIKKVKHPYEVALLKKAAQIAEHGLAEVLKNITIGTSEYDMERIYQAAVAKEGGYSHFFVVTIDERAAFSDTICTPTQKVRDGSMIRFDFGCIYKGYRSDLGRTAIVGKNEKAERYYEATRQGVETAIAAIRPGMPASEVFKIAVDTTKAAGIPHYVRHHCGHGIGQAPYDYPSIAPNFDMPIEEGMVMCIETPYYEIGWGGVMTEDTIHITKDGAEYITESSRDLIRLEV